jgi:16S rRNA processing protein RimM
MAAQRVKELLIYLAQGLVDEPDEVSVEQFEEDDGTVVLELAVAGAADGGEGRRGERPKPGDTRLRRASPFRPAPCGPRHRRLRRRAMADSGEPVGDGVGAARLAQGAIGTAGGGPSALEAGRVGRAHGLDGSFYVTRARPQLLAEGGEVTVAGTARRIMRRAGVEQRPIVRLQGIEDRLAAEALRGHTLTVASAQAPALGEGEWWAHELEGCTVLDGERPIGTVSGLLELPSCEALEVLREDGRELLVPMVGDAIRHVDVAAGRIDVSLDFLGES